MADNTNRIAGVATLSAGGRSYPLRGEFGYRVAKVKRATVAGQDGIHGYKEEPVPGQMKAKLTDSGDVSVAAINAMTNVTVIAELANGKIIVGRNMWSTEQQDVDTVEAQFDVVWEGPDVSEQAS